MTIFVVTAATEHAKVAASLHANYPNDHLLLGVGQWLVAGSGTAQDVSNKLGITGGENGLGIVVSISGYYGRMGSNVWEWIKTKWVTTSG